jgi:Holliday junction resolvase RusA-like endonuclease
MNMTHLIKPDAGSKSEQVYTLEFELPGLPKMANGGHGHWRADHAAKMAWRERVGLVLLSMKARMPVAPLKLARVTFTRFSSVEPDDDGLTHGFKPIRDALKFYGIIEDDKRKNLVAEYRWEKAKPKQGKVRIKVESL